LRTGLTKIEVLFFTTKIGIIVVRDNSTHLLVTEYAGVFVWRW